MQNSFDFETAKRTTDAFWRVRAFEFSHVHRYVNDRIIYGQVYRENDYEINPYYFLKDSDFFIECYRGVNWWGRCTFAPKRLDAEELLHKDGLLILKEYGMDLSEFLFNPDESIRTATSEIIKGI